MIFLDFCRSERDMALDSELKKDGEFSWQLFEKTGMVGAFLIYRETQKNIITFQKAKDRLLKEFGLDDEVPFKKK
jgi:hypothetical protein